MTNTISNLNTIEFNKAHCDCSKYIGTVTVNSYLDDRLIQTQTKHNSGLPKLFTFIANCLEGTWTEAKSNRPCKLALLKTAEAEEFSGENASTPIAKPEYWNVDYAVATPIMHDIAVVSSSSSNLASSITYHFRIPFLSLVSGSEIKKLILLPSNATSYATDACAYFILDNAIEVPTSGGNFTVVVDWTLTFENGGN